MVDLSRRRAITGIGGALGTALAGCTGSANTGGESTSDSSNGGNAASGKTYEVGHGDFQTTVNSTSFPKKLYVYAVQTGWSNWPALMKAVKKKYGFRMNDDQRSSGQALSDLRSHAQDPTHSAYNGGYTYGILAMNDGLTKAYKPANWDKVPDKLKTDNGHMTATRRMTSTVTYRKDIYEKRGLDAPETWEDLKHPDIMKDLQIQGPQAAVGLAAALSANNAYGGSLDNVDPVVNFYKKMQEKGGQFSSKAEQKFTKGEIATFVEYDYTGLDLKYNADSIAEEKVGVSLLTGPNGEKGAFNQPYGFGMLKGAPNPNACKVFMDYVLSLEGQRKFLDAFVRPIRAPELEMPDEFPDQSAYDEAEFQVDYAELVKKQESIISEIGSRAGLPGY